MSDAKKEKLLAVDMRRLLRRSEMNVELKPGHMYVEIFRDKYGPNEPGYGRLAWYGSDGKFYDADSEEEILDFDEPLIQHGPFKAEYTKLN